MTETGTSLPYLFFLGETGGAALREITFERFPVRALPTAGVVGDLLRRDLHVDHLELGPALLRGERELEPRGGVPLATRWSATPGRFSCPSQARGSSPRCSRPT